MKKILLLVLLLTLSACGFQLRGTAQLPFQTLYVDAGGNAIGPDLMQALRYGASARIVNSPGEAEAVLQVLSEEREKRILSLNAAGRVSEYLVLYRIFFRVHDGKGKDLLPAQQLELKRDFSYSDAQVLAKEQEEQLLYRDMLNDAVQQVMRRLGALKM